MRSILSGFLLGLSLATAEAVVVNTNFTAHEAMIVAASQPERAPRFNGARVIGARPGTPVVFSAAVSGERPMHFSATGLPDGLTMDDAGVITGNAPTAGPHEFKVQASNDAGKAEADYALVCGDALALTPPMGWNSYDAFGDSVREDEVLANARWLKEHLQPVGWDTVVVDFRWYDRLADGLRVQDPEGDVMDEFGRCMPATNRFPSAANGAGFGPLAAKIHAMGLKFGIHIMRGIPRRAVTGNLPIEGSSFTAAEAVRPQGDVNRTCVWNRDMFGVDATTPAGQAWYASVARQYASWGVDYIKCDDICNLQKGIIYDASEIEALSKTLQASGRSIVLSLSPGPAPLTHGEHLEKWAQLWRVSGDFWDNWRSLNRNFDLLSSWSERAGPGHWPDGDMIPLGHICVRNCDVRPDRWTRLTRDEQLTLMTLWALAPSPLMLGMNLPDNDEWTTALLTNPEVLAVNQDAAGKAARRSVGKTPGTEIWVKDLTDGSQAVGLFNRTTNSVRMKPSGPDLDFAVKHKVRDLWARQDVEPAQEWELPAHGCVLLRRWRATDF